MKAVVSDTIFYRFILTEKRMPKKQHVDLGFESITLQIAKTLIKYVLNNL